MAEYKMWNGTAWETIVGIRGEQGLTGAVGASGVNGWTPVFAVVSDGERRVLQITNWIGGSGTKPSVGFLTSTGTVSSTIAGGMDVRGAAGPVGPPGSVSLDTAQTITGTKTFPEGALLMTSTLAAGVEPYSDANPPNTLMMTNQGAIATVPTPAAGFTTAFIKRKGGRSLMATIGQSGLDSVYQPNIFANRISVWNAVANSNIATQQGIALTEITAGAAVAMTNTSFFSNMVRERFATTATAGVGAGIRTAVPQWTRTTVRNAGGFFFVARFGLNATTATNRVFVGLHSAATAIGNVNPSTLFNMVGFGCDAGVANLSFMTNDGSGAATQTTLGASFPSISSGGVAFYEARMYCVPGDGTNAGTINWSMERLDIAGAYVEGTASVDLPAIGTYLAAHMWHNNGTTAAIASLDIQSLYIESDN